MLYSAKILNQNKKNILTKEFYQKPNTPALSLYHFLHIFSERCYASEPQGFFLIALNVYPYSKILNQK